MLQVVIKPKDSPERIQLCLISPLSVCPSRQNLQVHRFGCRDNARNYTVKFLY